MPIDRPFRAPAAAAVLGLVLAAALLAPARPALAQAFTKITDAANPVATDNGAPGFTGVSWIDVDGNGWPDLFVGDRFVYLNAGGGVFSRQAIADNAGTIGHSWADYDNDGDPDLMVTGAGTGTGRGSRLFRNDGAGGLTLVTDGVMADSLGNAGWSCAWGDYDADGRVDLVIAAAFGFTGNNPNRLLHNDGGGAFSHDNTTDVTTGTAPYTVPTWCDFDLDGDLDLSIASGPANGFKGPDFFYRNMLREGGGAPLLARILTGPLAVDQRDGQVVNWPDYDNDGDLDCFITNFRLSTNSLYRNDGGTYVRMTGAQAGVIATDSGWNLANLWGDFDNDGDLDCFVVRTSNFANRYYRNEGNGTFTAQALGTLTVGPAITAAAADWDRDGDLDLYVSAASGGVKGLYRNNLAAGNHWFDLRLVGTQSNRSAIGAKVQLRATIGGQSVTQIREVSAQNTFNGQSSLVQHVGLGGATLVEALRVDWPSGLVESFTGLPVDTLLTLVEGAGLPTPTLAAIVSALVTPRGVELAWYGAALDPGAARVHRRGPEDAAAWEALGAAVDGGAHRATYLDATARPGAWAYRLGQGDAAGGIRWLTDEAWVDVPASPLALKAGVSPAQGGRLRLTFTLPGAGRARVQVFDVAGRRVAAEDLGARAAGEHTLDLASAALRPGVYWVRLRHEGAAVVARAVVVGGAR